MVKKKPSDGLDLFFFLKNKTKSWLGRRKSQGARRDKGERGNIKTKCHPVKRKAVICCNECTSDQLQNILEYITQQQQQQQTDLWEEGRRRRKRKTRFIIRILALKEKFRVKEKPASNVESDRFLSLSLLLLLAYLLRLGSAQLSSTNQARVVGKRYGTWILIVAFQVPYSEVEREREREKRGICSLLYMEVKVIRRSRRCRRRRRREKRPTCWWHKEARVLIFIKPMRLERDRRWNRWTGAASRVNWLLSASQRWMHSVVLIELMRNHRHTPTHTHNWVGEWVSDDRAQRCTCACKWGSVRFVV